MKHYLPIELASQQAINDIVKVEYFNNDLEKTYDRLFSEALEVIENRKMRFSNNSSIKVSGTYRIVRDDLGVYHPKGMYRQYDEAYESSLVNTNYSGNYVKKSARKDKTFYYEGVENTLGVDRVIDEISPVIGIQYNLRLSMIYELAE